MLVLLHSMKMPLSSAPPFSRIVQGSLSLVSWKGLFLFVFLLSPWARSTPPSPCEPLFQGNALQRGDLKIRFLERRLKQTPDDPRLIFLLTHALIRRGTLRIEALVAAGEVFHAQHEIFNSPRAPFPIGGRFRASQGGVFQLRERILNEHGTLEIWQDEQSGLLWSDQLPTPHGVTLSQAYQLLGRFPASGLSPFASEHPQIEWRLPKRDDFLRLEENGGREVLPHFHSPSISHTYWTDSQSWYPWTQLFNGETGRMNYDLKWGYLYSVRFVAEAID